MKKRDCLQDIRDALSLANLHRNITKTDAKRLELMVKEFFAEHWRDDDSPQAERTFGVRKAA